jgi:hypothetical protein
MSCSLLIMLSSWQLLNKVIQTLYLVYQRSHCFRKYWFKLIHSNLIICYSDMNISLLSQYQLRFEKNAIKCYWKKMLEYICIGFFTSSDKCDIFFSRFFFKSYPLISSGNVQCHINYIINFQNISHFISVL